MLLVLFETKQGLTLCRSIHDLLVSIVIVFSSDSALPCRQGRRTGGQPGKRHTAALITPTRTCRTYEKSMPISYCTILLFIYGTYHTTASTHEHDVQIWTYTSENQRITTFWKGKKVSSGNIETVPPLDYTWTDSCAILQLGVVMGHSSSGLFTAQ